ncbi:hypothetical protein CF149_02384 [Pseudomonas psychrophila]|nr:hypothetical protein CF149_02384 [Pseudomonas psychrophila]
MAKMLPMLKAAAEMVAQAAVPLLALSPRAAQAERQQQILMAVTAGILPAKPSVKATRSISPWPAQMPVTVAAVVPIMVVVLAAAVVVRAVPAEDRSSVALAKAALADSPTTPLTPALSPSPQVVLAAQSLI